MDSSMENVNRRHIRRILSLTPNGISLALFSSLLSSEDYHTCSAMMNSHQLILQDGSLIPMGITECAIYFSEISEYVDNAMSYLLDIMVDFDEDDDLTHPFVDCSIVELLENALHTEGIPLSAVAEIYLRLGDYHAYCKDHILALRNYIRSAIAMERCGKCYDEQLKVFVRFCLSADSFFSEDGYDVTLLDYLDFYRTLYHAEGGCAM